MVTLTCDLCQQKITWKNDNLRLSFKSSDGVRIIIISGTFEYSGADSYHGGFVTRRANMCRDCIKKAIESGVIE